MPEYTSIAPTIYAELPEELGDEWARYRMAQALARAWCKCLCKLAEWEPELLWGE